MSVFAGDTPPARQMPGDGITDSLRTAYQANIFLRTALDQASDGVLILQPVFEDEPGPKVLFSNIRMAVLAGAEPRAGLRGFFLSQLLPSAEESSELIHALHAAARMGGAGQWQGDLKALHGGKNQRCNWRIRAVQDEFGRLQNYTLTISPIPQPAVAHAAAMPRQTMDDTKRLRNDNLASISLGVLHDLNNLLGIIMTNLSVAQDGAPPNSPSPEHVAEALAAAQQAREFTMQTLRMARDVPLQRESADLGQVIREATRVAQSGSGVKVHLHLPKDLWWSVIDKTKIAQVLQNLVINGIQAMGNSGLMDVLARNRTIPSNHDRLPPGPYVEVLVRDRGCGMPPEVLDKALTESFTTKADGNGIGLATCRRIIEEHLGQIELSSMQDVGTEVRFWLPASKPQLVPVSHPTADATLIPGSGAVLVVDDEDKLRKVIVAVLKQCGYRVYEAASGDDAVELYRQSLRNGEEMDLVIMDLTLKGGLCGEEAMLGIKKLNADAKIIASSGGLLEENRERHLDLGFCDILPKPYLAPAISAMVHHHIMRIAAPQPAGL